jgi:putative oxidoreductase
MAQRGIEPSAPAAYLIFFLETVGATCLILGLFTRFFAMAIAIELAVITFYVQWRNGFGNWEFAFLWGLVVFAIALRGGGPHALDRKLGWEL